VNVWIAGGTAMRTTILAACAAMVAAVGLMAAPVPARAECHMEKQCRWVNFKKTCVWVKVCR
jgi:hypothetical protein